ncbi:hypothetical protein BKA93DRAFT_814971 [Sparassis latifolia]
MAVWGVFDFCLLGSGVLMLALSIVWREPNLMINIALSTMHLNAALILAILFIVTFVISIGAMVQKNPGILGFVVLNWALIVDAIATLVVGTIIWFYSLQERNNYYAVWKMQTNTTRVAVQNEFSCCGYFLPNDTAAIGGFCVSDTFVNSLPTTSACVSHITAFADDMLQPIFTYIYFFMGIVLCLLLASLCVIKTRTEVERFRKIDAKRGGGGFV